MVGEVTDWGRLQALGDSGVLASLRHLNKRYFPTVSLPSPLPKALGLRLNVPPDARDEDRLATAYAGLI
jgi:hypothetical protein